MLQLVYTFLLWWFGWNDQCYFSLGNPTPYNSVLFIITTNENHNLAIRGSQVQSWMGNQAVLPKCKNRRAAAVVFLTDPFSSVCPSGLRQNKRARGTWALTNWMTAFLCPSSLHPPSSCLASRAAASLSLPPELGHKAPSPSRCTITSYNSTAHSKRALLARCSAVLIMRLRWDQFWDWWLSERVRKELEREWGVDQIPSSHKFILAFDVFSCSSQSFTAGCRNVLTFHFLYLSLDRERERENSKSDLRPPAELHFPHHTLPTTNETVHFQCHFLFQCLITSLVTSEKIL